MVISDKIQNNVSQLGTTFIISRIFGERKMVHFEQCFQLEKPKLIPRQWNKTIFSVVTGR